MSAHSDWIERDGGPNPVREGETLVALRFRSGWEGLTAVTGFKWKWGEDGKGTITHYRVTPPRASMSADEVLVRAREAVIEVCKWGAGSADKVRNAEADNLHEIRAILAFHRDLSRTLAEVAPHTVEDADERAAWEIYATQMHETTYPFAERHKSLHYRCALAAYRAGKDAA